MGHKIFDEKTISERFEKNCGSEFSLVGEYKNSFTPVKVRHNCDKCGNFEWTAVPKNTFLKKRLVCPKCNNKMGFLKPELHLKKEKINQIIDDSYTIIEPSARRDLAMKLIHNTEDCAFNNREFYISPNRYIKYIKEGFEPCPGCRQKQKKALKSIAKFKAKSSASPVSKEYEEIKGIG